MFLNRNLFNAAVMLLFLYSGSLKAADIAAPAAVLNDGNSLNDPIIKIDIGPDVVGGGGGGLSKGVPPKVANPKPSSNTSGSTSGKAAVAVAGVVGGTVSAVVKDPSIAVGVVGSVTPVSGGVSSSNGGSNAGGAESPAPIPEVDPELKRIYDNWMNRWIKIFKALTDESIAIKNRYAYDVERCAVLNQVGSELHARCVKNATDSMNEAAQLLEKRIVQARSTYEEERKSLGAPMPVLTGTVTSPSDGKRPVAIPGSAGSAGAGQDVNNPSTAGTGTATGTAASVNTATNATNNTSTTTNTTTVVNNSTTNTTVNTGANANAKVQEIPKFEDLNDFADYCKTNPNSLMCTKLDEPEERQVDFGISEFIAQLMGVLKENGEKGLPDFTLDKFLGSGSRQCPAPLTMSVHAYTATMSFDWVCKFLISVKPFVVMCFLIMTTMLVIGGARK